MCVGDVCSGCALGMCVGDVRAKPLGYLSEMCVGCGGVLGMCVGDVRSECGGDVYWAFVLGMYVGVTEPGCRVARTTNVIPAAPGALPCRSGHCFRTATR